MFRLLTTDLHPVILLLNKSYNFSRPIQASQVFADSIQVTSLTLHWNRGNDSICSVFGRKGNSGNASPENGTPYAANSQFGTGDQIGTTGWYCVYTGNGSKVKVTGLEILTDYIFQVIEHDADFNPLYYTSNGQSNPLVTQTNVLAEQTDISLSLTGVSYGSVAWGDYNNDGNQDILMTGTTNGSVTGAVTKIYRNNGNNTFTEQSGFSLPGLMNSSVAWGDYNNDGYLDILLTGLNINNIAVSKIFRNNGNNSFSEQTDISLVGVRESSVAWSDFDNDGDLDIILTGTSGSGEITKIYRNNGNNTFAEQQGINLPGVTNGSVVCADYDKDGYTDILLTGSGLFKIYRNNGNPLTMEFTEQTGIKSDWDFQEFSSLG